MFELSAEALRIFMAKSFANVAMTAEDGKPTISVVWIDEKDGKLLFNSTEQRQKGRVLNVGEPVAISAMDPEDPYRYVAVRGSVASRYTEGAVDDINMLARKYRGRDFNVSPGSTRVSFLIEPHSQFIYPEDLQK
ncbi:MAG: hypothetical protein NVSMB57_17670 [Actinomycetota bacterium]